jgi:hypothetical protein
MPVRVAQSPRGFVSTAGYVAFKSAITQQMSFGDSSKVSTLKKRFLS